MSILEMYNNRHPLGVIAYNFGMSISTIKRMLKEVGYQPNRINGTRIPREQALQAAEMDLEGYSWREISRRLGPSTKALKRAVEYYATQNPIE